MTSGHLWSVWIPSSVSLMFLSPPPPDPSGCKQHSARKPPSWHLRPVDQSGPAGPGRVRGVRLPQRQDLPLSCRERLLLPGHEQHLPVELTRQQSKDTCNISGLQSEIGAKWEGTDGAPTRHRSGLMEAAARPPEDEVVPWRQEYLQNNFRNLRIRGHNFLFFYL